MLPNDPNKSAGILRITLKQNFIYFNFDENPWISRTNKGANYLSQSTEEQLSSTMAMVRHNTSRSSLALAAKLSNRCMQRTINLYTRSNRHIAQFDVFLQTSDSDRCMIIIAV